MIIESTWKKYQKLKKEYDDYNESEKYGNWVAIGKRSLNTAFLIFIISFISVLIIIPFSIYLTLYCGRKNKWNVWFTTLIILSFFTPYIGFFTVLFMLIYGIMCYSNNKNIST
jgi:ABC-type phosphate transport system permease subunit